MLEQALQYARQNHERFLNELKDFLAIPSISTDPEHEADMHAAAEWARRNCVPSAWSMCRSCPPADIRLSTATGLRQARMQ